MRFVPFVFLFFVVILPFCGAVAAPEVRLGQHTGFSRLVFEWERGVSYTVDKSKGSVTVSFAQPGAVSNASVLRDGLIKGVDVLSSNPLRVRIDFPSGSRVRDFVSDTRVVVDVYGARPKNSQATKAPAPTPSSSSLASLKDVAKELEALNPKQAIPDAVQPLSAALAKPKEIAVPAPSEPLSVLDKVLQTETQAHQITVSSTKAIGLAAFRLGGALYLVNDRTDLLLKPYVSGPNAEAYTPVRVSKGGDVSVHKVPVGGALNLRVEGGGLLWKLIVAGAKETARAILPQRKDALSDAQIEAGMSRGGYVLWPFKDARMVVDIDNPLTGGPMHVVTVPRSGQFAGGPYEFVDFSVLPSPVGLAIVPKVDDLKVEVTRKGVKISRAGALALTPDHSARQIQTISRLQSSRVATASANKVFDFANWKMGDLETVRANKNVILGSMQSLEPEERAEALVMLGKMYVSHGLWAEALGFFRFAEQLGPDLRKNPEVQALKGVALALGHSSEEAFRLLSDDAVSTFDEINHWRSFALAELGDWQQAIELLPESFAALETYPVNLARKVVPGVMEVALRAGNTDAAEDLLSIARQYQNTMDAPERAALVYLEGELERQKGDPKKTLALWEPLITGPDDLYRAKAGLAYARLKMEEENVDPEASVNMLERLRYSWRGDELEAQIHYWLGKTYFEKQDYIKGLSTLRDAMSLDGAAYLRPRIAKEMSETFKNFFLSEGIDETSPLEALTLYEQFTELAPPGEEGNQIGQRLADRLAQADLLDRAATLLQTQVDYRLEGPALHRVSNRLAGIYLLNKKPDEALKAIRKATAAYDAQPPSYKTSKRDEEIAMLTAQALSQKRRVSEALKILEDLGNRPDINLLRADIAWRSGSWGDASIALGDVLVDQNVSLSRPLSDESRDLILQYALALNLAGDRIGVANVRERYSDLMNVTPKGRVFDVVTRPRQSSALANRETLLGIVNEVEMFSGFLDTYKEGSAN